MTNKEIKDLMRFFDNSDISKVKIKNGEFSIELQKGYEECLINASPAPVQSAPVVAQVAMVESDESTKVVENKKHDLTINSPMVGTFYIAPSPGSEPFVKVGTVVRKGQAIAIIEAMKIMNEIEAEFDCRITEVLASDGQPVEFGLPLFAVEKV